VAPLLKKIMVQDQSIARVHHVINEIFVAIIPGDKVSNGLAICRSIHLFIVNYKNNLQNFFVERLTPCMDKLISKNQMNLMPRRKILDSVRVVA
jgi:hypothetical protein